MNNMNYEGITQESIQEESKQEEGNVEIIKPVTFPRALTKFKQYNGAKTFAALLFGLESFYFASGIFNLITWQNTWWRPDFAVKFGYFLYHLFIFAMIYCLTWLIFDRRGIEGYALAIFSVFIGIVYFLSPLDFIPDIIPAIGILDDISIGIGGIALGVRSWMNSRQRSMFAEKIGKFIENNQYQQAIESFLIQEGYQIKR